MRIFSPRRSSSESISLLYQPPICMPVLPTTIGFTPKGA